MGPNELKFFMTVVLCLFSLLSMVLGVWLVMKYMEKGWDNIGGGAIVAFVVAFILIAAAANGAGILVK